MSRERKIEAVLDVLAPKLDGYHRTAIFEWGHETTPTADELRELAEQIVASLESVGEEQK